MNAAHIPKLATLLEAYFDGAEFIDQTGIFGVDVGRDAPLSGSRVEWLAVATRIVQGLENGNMRAFLSSLLEQLETRNATAIASTTWERRDANEALRPLLQDLTKAQTALGAPSEIALPARSGFSAKSQVRELLEQATTPIFIVDPYIGVGTLDCLRTLTQPVRLLAGSSPQAIEKGLDAALSEFQDEGRVIEVRRAAMLHDRHVVFNDRCWLVGSSLKDAGHKAFHCIEVVDAKARVIADLEARWSAAVPFP